MSYLIYIMAYSLEQLNDNPWLAVQDVVGNTNTWPKFIRKMFWDKNLKDHNRMILVNFAYLNAISEDFLHDILTFTLKQAYTNERKRNIKDRFAYLNHEELGHYQRSRVYSYHVYFKEMLDLNFNPRKNY